MNRRNLLIGIGTAAVGSGAVLGSGALTSVQADRSFSVTTTGDGSAKIKLTSNSQYEIGGNGGNGESILAFEIKDINDDAVTTITEAFTIENNSSEDLGVTVDAVDTDDDPVTGVHIYETGTTNDLSSQPGANDAANNLASSTSDSVTVDIEIDTTSSGATVSNIDMIEIVAKTSFYQS